MKLDVMFQENKTSLKADFGEVNNISDGGYERGYASGYDKGEAEGHKTGYAEGLSKREYEIWTFTLVDGTIVEKEVALL